MVERDTSSNLYRVTSEALDETVLIPEVGANVRASLNYDPDRLGVAVSLDVSYVDDSPIAVARDRPVRSLRAGAVSGGLAVGF
jgi:hypothetical protein